MKQTIIGFTIIFAFLGWVAVNNENRRKAFHERAIKAGFTEEQVQILEDRRKQEEDKKNAIMP